MSLPYSRISTATVDDVIFYDPAAERRADSLSADWDTYFSIASQELLQMMEFGWWPKYVEQTFGAWYFKNDTAGRLVTAFDPSKLLKSSQILKRLDTFKAIEEFYRSLVTDVSNLNEVDQKNYEFAKARFDDEWRKAIELGNFYDINSDGVISKMEENMNADQNFFNRNQRYF
jgi:hypothetical protein